MNDLETLAQRLGEDAFFLAHALGRFAHSESLDDAGLATALGCSPETLTMLRLCRSPRHDSFKADIDSIAARFQVDAGILADAVRRGQAIAVMQARQPEQTGGMLLAARDDDRPPEEQS